MLKTLDIVEEEGALITGRQINSGAINSQPINDSDL